MSPHEAPRPGADPDRPVHIVFVGAGAVGCFYASRLHHPAHNVHVSLIARSNYKALAADGVRLQTHTFGDYTFRPHAVYPSVAAAAANPPHPSGAGPQEWDFIIVTTKALPDRSDDSALIAPLVGARSCIVLIQNGVGVEAPYRARFPANPIVSAVTVVSAEQTAPGTVRQNRWTRIHLGPYSDSAPLSAGTGTDPDRTNCSPGRSAPSPLDLQRAGAARAAQLADWWSRLGGIRDVEVTDETGLQTVRWHKLCINAAFNPTAVLAGGRGNADMVRRRRRRRAKSEDDDDGGGGVGGDNDDDAGEEELRAHLAGVMEEIWAAAPRILGRPFPAHMATPERILRSTERNVGSKPSMLLDWEADRPLELEVILGNPVRIARARGVELPRVQTLYALLRSAQAVREREKKKARPGRGKL